jgi:predicted DNA-binding transcriptional regulator YafY
LPPLIHDLPNNSAQDQVDCWATAAWVKDRTWHASQRTTPQTGGRLRMTLRVAATPELVGWILGFGGGVRVLGPAELQEAVRTAAEQILART